MNNDSPTQIQWRTVVSSKTEFNDLGNEQFYMGNLILILALII